MRLIFSQANKHCPPQEGGHPRCQWRQLFRKPTKWKPAVLPWWLCSSQPRLPKPQPKRLSYPAGSQLQQSFGIFHLCVAPPASRCPPTPAPGSHLHPAAGGPTLLGGPGQGHPGAGTEGLPQLPAPSTQPLPARRPPKMSPWQPCGTLAWFSLLRAERRGWKLRLLRPRRVPGSGSGAGMHGQSPCPPPGPGGTAGPALGGRRVPRRRRPEELEGTAGCHRSPETRLVHGCLQRLRGPA